VIKH